MPYDWEGNNRQTNITCINNVRNNRAQRLESEALAVTKWQTDNTR